MPRGWMRWSSRGVEVILASILVHRRWTMFYDLNVPWPSHGPSSAGVQHKKSKKGCNEAILSKDADQGATEPLAQLTPAQKLCVTELAYEHLQRK